MELVDLIDRQSLSRMIEEMAADDRVDLLECLDREHVESLLPLIAQAERTDIRKLLSYPEESAGAIMTTEYASLPRTSPCRRPLKNCDCRRRIARRFITFISSTSSAACSVLSRCES
ncbi:MAG: hypothetical protein R3C12_16525 [Planctomycetaceae bacterium]